MFCPKCGRETPDENTTYCLGCGLNLGSLVFPTDEEADALKSAQVNRAPFTYELPAEEPAQPAGYVSETSPYHAPYYDAPHYDAPADVPADAEAPVKKKKSAAVIILAVILGVLVAGGIAALAIFLLTGGRRIHIPLNDYVDVTFEGYDGHGTAEAQFDEERFMADYAGKIKLTGKGKRSLNEDTEIGFLTSFTEDSDMAALFPLLFENGYLTPSTDLKNGDSVTFQWSLSEASQEQLNEYMRCTVDASDKTFMVSGLDDVMPVDLFAGLTLMYTGVAPDGRAEIENLPSDDYTRDLQYEIDPPDGLSNGDLVTVTAVAPDGDLDAYLAENYSVRAQEAQKTFTVEGLNAVAESYEDISDEVKREMDRKAQELLDEYFQSMQDTLSYTEATPAGAFYLKAKDTENAPDGQNMVILAYRVKTRVTAVEDIYEYVGDTEYFTWVSFRDITMTEDGGSEVDPETAVFTDNTFFYQIPDTYNGIDWLGSDLRGWAQAAEMEAAARSMYENDYDITSYLENTGTGTGSAPGGNEQTDNPDELIIEDNPDDELIIEDNPDDELIIEDEGGTQPDG